jgi:hypothetical protein
MKRTTNKGGQHSLNRIHPVILDHLLCNGQKGGQQGGKGKVGIIDNDQKATK